MSASLFLRRAAAAPASASARAFSTTSRLGLSRLHLIGNLADSPELHATSSGREIVRYTVATSMGPRDNRRTSWWKVTSFAEGGARDYLMNVAKGSRVFVDGDISTNSYTDPNGIQRIGISVVQRTIEVIVRQQEAEPSEAAESAESTEGHEQER